jgi:hypothetical protein
MHLARRRMHQALKEAELRQRGHGGEVLGFSSQAVLDRLLPDPGRLPAVLDQSGQLLQSASGQPHIMTGWSAVEGGDVIP